MEMIRLSFTTATTVPSLLASGHDWAGAPKNAQAPNTAADYFELATALGCNGNPQGHHDA
jgi:hypothetical protein